MMSSPLKKLFSDICRKISIVLKCNHKEQRLMRYNTPLINVLRGVKYTPFL